ncbi:MAG: M15 family metallopeptidase, partial [Myxococcota bacterium]
FSLATGTLYERLLKIMKQALYPRHATCYLRPRSATALVKAEHNVHRLGYRLVLFDCYRPLSVQQKMFEIVNNPKYVAKPTKKGGKHYRGAAVDVGLADATGRVLPMPTEFDDFTSRAGSAADKGIEWFRISNRTSLQEAMEAAGFARIKSEWWHFVGPDARTAAALDEPFPKSR